jgi:hypothetical protein
MLRLALAVALGFSVITLAGGYSAAEDKETKAVKLEGKLVCTKCKLSETDSCGNALLVKKGDETVTYYLKDKGKGEKYHKCAGEQAATVTGKVSKDGDKMIISEAKVVKK